MKRTAEAISYEPAGKEEKRSIEHAGGGISMTITTIGEILVDMTQTGRDENGILLFAANPGGAPANVAVAASKLGVRTAFIGCIGNDAYGDLLEETLIRFGVSTEGLQRTDAASTTLAVVTVDEAGERSFSFCRKPGADTCIDASRAVRIAEQADILHFGSVSLTDPACREATISAIRAAKAGGALITYDPNYRAALWESEEEAVRQMRAVLSLCDVVKISDEETGLLAGKEDPEEAADVLLAQGAELVLVTLGADGALWKRGDRSGVVPGFSVKVADTNGAGDTFFGAFLARIAWAGGPEKMTDEDISEAVRFANRAASLTTSRPGAIPAMPTIDELTK